MKPLMLLPVLTFVASLAAAADSPMPAPITSAKAVKWAPAPNALPPGAEMVVLTGDPGASGLVMLRAKLPPNYTVPAHWHPTDEHVTVLSGTVLFGMGDKADASKAQPFTAGGYVVAHANMHHFAMTKTGAVIQVDLMGPFAITYVNPADDPRTKGTK